MRTSKQIDLNSRWRFSPDPHRDGESLGFWRRDYSARLWREVTVPSCFEAGCPNLHSYQGLCWYRRTFTVPDTWCERRVVLRFEAVNYRAKVWMNDHLLGESQDGFLPFEFEVPTEVLRKDGNELAVAVDNAHYPGDVPGMHVGWRGFGGIIREVALRTTEPLFVKDVRVLAVPAADQGGSAEFRVQVMNTHGSARQVGLEVEIRDSDNNVQSKFTADKEVVEAGAAREFVLAGHVDTIRSWSPATPHLYKATVRFTAEGQAVAEHEVSFGFRRIEVSGDALLLNGEKIFLTGFNRHDDSPRTDMAVDHALIRSDLDAIKKAGANMVRLCHYPHHPAELDYCDRIGLLVFAEIPLYFWNDTDEGKRTNAERVQSATRQLERMIARDFNHPSIIFWSVSNETQERDPEVVDSNRQLIRKCRALDPSRLHVHVSNCWLDFEEDDVICVNAYPSIDWQRNGHNPAEYDAESIKERWIGRLTGIRQRYPGKPVLVTEFGYGSFAGTQGHSFGEDEHARVIAVEFSAFTEALVCGALIWCWADHPWPAGRFLGGLSISPHGVLDRDRRQLKPFQTARELFRAKQGIREPAEKKAVKNNNGVIMIRPHMRELPMVPFPDGYGIRPMTLGDIGLWTDIQRDAEPYINITDDTFMYEFGNDPGALARRCFIITGPKQLGMGTISAWYEQDYHGEEYGRIHWISVRPAAQGKGLGKAALAYAMHQIARWHDKCYLATSINRIPAIRLYLKFGFIPDMRAPNAAENWDRGSDLLKEAGLA